MTDDGRLCVFDFGAVAVLPDGLPRQWDHYSASRRVGMRKR
jgi:hypothetical protein